MGFYFFKESMSNYSTCGRKQIYLSKTSARKAAKERKIFCGHKIYFYHCDACEYWHLTKEEPDRHIITIGSLKKLSLRKGIAKIIQTSNDERKEFIERLSINKTIFRIRHPFGIFLVLYRNKQKDVTILEINRDNNEMRRM